MGSKLTRLWIGAAAVTACALIGAAVAFAAGSGAKTAATTTTTATARPARTPETPLTGAVLDQAKAAALAKVGGTVDSATTENDGGDANAAYEVHVTKTDGSHVTVILDASYDVLAVETGPAGGHGGPRGGGNGETPLTGDAATQAKAAAVAKVGGTADFATTETDSSDANAAYEVHVTKADGSRVTVILDTSYDVLTVEACPGPHAG